MAVSYKIVFFKPGSREPLYEMRDVPVPRVGETVTFPSGRWWRVTAVRHIYDEPAPLWVEVTCKLRDDR